jgi:crotonobetainyl-CoA:carnitine CoA-transferase CaiB-like acyl-CoA transferase
MKLEGVRVIDLSVFLPGPYLTLAMADHGAEVIKVETPGEGDPGRHIGLSDGPSTVFFRNLNRGKKSIVVDLKDAGQRDRLLALCKTADVFVESFRPGTVDRLGVGYDAVRAQNPGIIYCAISAFGQDGPMRGRPAHDLALQAESGLLSVTLGSDGKPAMPGIPVADVVAGLQGLSGVLMALFRRQQTGIGDYIDISMHDVTLGAMLNILGPPLAQDRQPVAAHERTTGGAAFYRPYETSDGRYLVLAGQEPKFINNLLGELGRPDLAELCLRGPGPHQQPVVDFLAATFREKPLAEWNRYLETLDVCFGRINTLPEALAQENLEARKMIRRDELGRRHIAPPIHFREEPASPVLREPRLGEHTQMIFGVKSRAFGG